jgi:hypothetical protein
MDGRVLGEKRRFDRDEVAIGGRVISGWILEFVEGNSQSANMMTMVYSFLRFVDHEYRSLSTEYRLLFVILYTKIEAYGPTIERLADSGVD